MRRYIIEATPTPESDEFEFYADTNDIGTAYLIVDDLMVDCVQTRIYDRVNDDYLQLW